MTIAERMVEISRLSVDERIELAEAIWESVADEVDKLDVPQWHLDEIDRRLEASRDDPKAGTPWEEVKAQLLGRRESLR